MKHIWHLCIWTSSIFTNLPNKFANNFPKNENKTKQNSPCLEHQTEDVKSPEQKIWSTDLTNGVQQQKYLKGPWNMWGFENSLIFSYNFFLFWISYFIIPFIIKLIPLMVVINNKVKSFIFFTFITESRGFMVPSGSVINWWDVY